MFSNSSTSSSSFPSTWKKERVTSSAGMQTDKIICSDAGVQISYNSSIGTQTEEKELPLYKVAEYDESSLLTFLTRVAPKVEKELEKSIRSRAFVGHSIKEEISNAEAKILHTLKWQLNDEHVITCLDWNASGAVVGVGYGMSIHDGWCSHKGVIAFWNINRPDLVSNNPDDHLEVSTCVTCLSFHPTNPAIVAVGNKSGEILIYDLISISDAMTVHSGDSEGVEITALKWQESAPLTALNFPHQRGSFILVCTTMAGHVLMWNNILTKDPMSLMNGFIISTQDIRQLRSRYDSSEVAITSIDFSRNDPTFFVVGTEAGAVLLCSALSQVSSGVKMHGVNLYRCVTSYLSPHNGRVLSVSVSPFHRNAIFTVGSDNSIRLFSLLQSNIPAAVIHLDEELTCSQFSFSRPLVVLSGEASGSVHFHNLDTNKMKPELQLKATDKSAVISSMALCRKKLNILAVGDHLGRVFIWTLPETVVSTTHTEQERLNELLQISQDS